MGSPNEQSHSARPDLLASPKNHFRLEAWVIGILAVIPDEDQSLR